MGRLSLSLLLREFCHHASQPPGRVNTHGTPSSDLRLKPRLDLFQSWVADVGANLGLGLREQFCRDRRRVDCSDGSVTVHHCLRTRLSEPRGWVHARPLMPACGKMVSPHEEAY